jgi:2-enoate reductase
MNKLQLFETGRIGRLTLKNRVVMAPMASALGELVEDSRLSQRGLDFYIARARGGVGLIIPGVVLAKLRFAVSVGEQAIISERSVHWLNDLAEAVHAHGAKICTQLSIGMGRNQVPNPSLPNGGTVSASAIPNFWDPKIISPELTIGEIESLIEDYEFAAKIVANAGIDAIEIHGHIGYLIDQFMTQLWNKRTDRYGGDLDGRLRLPLELFAAAKRGAGEDFPVTCRYCLTHYVDGGRTIEEGLEIACRFEAAGFAALHIDGGCYEALHLAFPPTTQPMGLWVNLAEKVKRVVKIPVIVAGKLGDPKLAEEVLEEGKADFVALGRPLLADPDWANKVKEGRPEDITPCIGCHEGCLKRYFEGKYVSCAVNPACGREKESIITPVEKKKSVIIVGSGPAGMEAARVAALRGHKVTLLEKTHTLGGNLVPASIPDFKLDYKRFLDYLTTQIRKLCVTTKLGVKATPEMIQKIKPEVVLVATGATHCIPDIPGIKEGMEKGKVVTAVDVLLGKKEAGRSIAIIGAGLVGCETALWLANQGKKVTVVECLDALRDTFFINADDIKEKLDDAKVKILENTNVLEVTDSGIAIVDEQGKGSTLEADTVILAVGMLPDRELLEALEELPEVYAVGDCVDSRGQVPRKIC